MTSPSIARPVSLASSSPARAKTARSIIVGRVLSSLAIAFLVLDGAVKLFPVKAVIDSSVQLGYPVTTMPGIGLTLLTCVLLYAVPRTSVLGAVLLTGYLGGAIATHVRVQNPVFSHILFPTYIAAIAWGGLLLRDARLRAFLPFKR